MPNWVHNHLTFKGPDDQLGAVAGRLGAAGAVLSFHSLIPRPASSDGDFYAWNTENWGTKWDAHEPECTTAPGQLEYYFETAWTPPTGFINKVLNEFPDLDWTYRYEEEQGWGGSLEVTAGRITTQEAYDAPESHADLAARGRQCSCFAHGHSSFDDCFAHRARELPGLDTQTREALDVLAREWEGSFDELVAAASRL